MKSSRSITALADMYLSYDCTSAADNGISGLTQIVQGKNRAQAMAHKACTKLINLVVVAPPIGVPERPHSIEGNEGRSCTLNQAVAATQIEVQNVRIKSTPETKMMMLMKVIATILKAESTYNCTFSTPLKMRKSRRSRSKRNVRKAFILFMAALLPVPPWPLLVALSAADFAAMIMLKMDIATTKLSKKFQFLSCSVQKR
mmetsp:Transcript_39256/g.101801  ORF Transcript_39256/g.101801 Transcript_39256/m.101801 type:complete len:201 (-) Transcript_39256:425-1027(-)